MLRRCLVVALGALAGCSPGRSSTARVGDDSPRDVLRVSTSFRLSSLRIDTRETASCHLDAFAPSALSTEFSSLRVDGNDVHLGARPGVGPSRLAELAGAFRHPELVAARVAPGGVLVTLRSAAGARALTLSTRALALGRYEEVAWSPDRLVLRRRGPGRGMARIELESFDSDEDEWRRFLGGEVDVVPWVAPGHLAALRAVPTVRLVPLADPATTAIMFQVQGAAADARLRRAIALGLRRRAIARVVGDSSAARALEAVEDVAAARTLLAGLGVSPAQPRRLRLLVVDTLSELRRVAIVLQEQLAPLGVDLDVEVRSSAEVSAAVVAGAFDALLFFGGTTPRYWRLVHTGPPAIDVTRYSNRELDAAVDHGDGATVAAILAHDVPLTPLYVVHEAAALDRGLCGARPRVVHDWSWLADVHRCAAGERE